VGTSVQEPFARGSISLRLYPHNDLPAPEVVAELCAQAQLALSHGFDGIMTSEHHGGFPGYLPNPLQMATFVLEESTAGWAAACPLLLPLRPTALVAEEVAWLAARHPGRVGVGVAAGALPLDFEVTGVPLGSAVATFKAELPRLVHLLQGRDLGDLRADPALRRCGANPVPVLSAAASATAATRAAAAGAGILMEGMSSADRLAGICARFDEAGGRATKMLIRRVWLGDRRRDLVERQRRVYDSYSGGPGGTGGTDGFGDDQTISAHDPVEAAGRLHEVLTTSGANAINLRIHLPGMSPAEVRKQIVGLGQGVVPVLRKLLRSGT
jgi:alkanesulfonate monooxygenase SsuD/methylene tetrahydromethanopterin reductase-like flavin-dependent oxidoreductase (luciferase family)